MTLILTLLFGQHLLLRSLEEGKTSTVSLEEAPSFMMRIMNHTTAVEFNGAQIAEKAK
jgi:hypothetical protein